MSMRILIKLSNHRTVSYVPPIYTLHIDIVPYIVLFAIFATSIAGTTGFFLPPEVDDAAPLEGAAADDDAAPLEDAAVEDDAAVLEDAAVDDDASPPEVFAWT